MNLFEIKILDFIQDVFKCSFMDSFMQFVTKLGDRGIFWIILAVVFIIFNKTRKTGISMGIALIIGLIVVNLILKNTFARVRPYDVNSAIQLLIEPLSSFSFPSGHTVSSFEAAFAIFIRNKKLGIPALLLAGLIAFSRLYLYVHYPTDVLASVILGIAFAILASFITDKIYSLFENKKINKQK